MFDLRTHIMDPKTGQLLKHQPYRRVCEGQSVYYIRDGVAFYEDGTLMKKAAPPETKGPASAPKAN